MIVYTVHGPGELAGASIDQAERLVFVKDGFAWLAAFPYTTAFWLLSHRLWIFALGYAAALAVIGGVMILYPVARTPGGLALVLLHLALGLEGNGLRRWSLGRQGYRMVGVASGRSVEECERRFFDGWFSATKLREGGVVAATGSPIAVSPGAVGLTATTSLADRLAATTTEAPATADGWERLKAALSDLKR